MRDVGWQDGSARRDDEELYARPHRHRPREMRMPVVLRFVVGPKLRCQRTLKRVRPTCSVAMRRLPIMGFVLVRLVVGVSMRERQCWGGESH